MAEEPIKLFATRAERYPQPDDTDIAHGAARVALSAIPVLGGSITELFSQVVAPALVRRRDQWFKELADALDELGSKVDGFNVNSLIDNDSFISATLQATLIAATTHRREKREMLRNALLNIAVERGPGEELQEVFLNAIESLSCSHVKVLKVIWNGTADLHRQGFWVPGAPSTVRDYGTAFEILVPELKGQVAFVQCILNDLRNRGFSNLSGPDAVFPQGSVITNLGIQFLHFVLEAPSSTARHDAAQDGDAGQDHP